MESLEADVSLENPNYNFGKEDRNNCPICFGNPGFPLVCNAGDPGGHRFCVDCAYAMYQQPGEVFICPICRLPFNFQDYLVVRELHLIHLFSDDTRLHYFGGIQWRKTVYASFRDICWEDFFWLGEQDQKRVISKIYWGNSLLFDGTDDYPINNAKDKRVKENLLEMLGNLWSPELDTEEKNQQLIEALTNGIYVQALKNELTETFLHRCHIFLRAFFPLHNQFNRDIIERMQWIKGPFPEYNTLQNMEHKDLVVANRPPSGPMGEEVFDWMCRGNVDNKNLNLHLIPLVGVLKNDLKDLFVCCMTRLYLLPLCCFAVGLGFRQAINLVLIQSGLTAIILICGFLCYKYLVDGIEQRIHLVNFMRKLVTLFNVGMMSFLIVDKVRNCAALALLFKV